MRTLVEARSGPCAPLPFSAPGIEAMVTGGGKQLVNLASAVLYHVSGQRGAQTVRLEQQEQEAFQPLHRNSAVHLQLSRHLSKLTFNPPTYRVFPAEAGSVVLVRVHASVHAVLAAHRRRALHLRQHLLAKRAAERGRAGAGAGGRGRCEQQHFR